MCLYSNRKREKNMYKHSLPKKTVILVIVAALAVSLLSSCSVLKGKSAADYCVYIKDN